ncbi:Vacuolar protein sorting/targeting protein 10 [Thelohanellus kitauei]|uniref:Vacuolar protein sorting/targeting protein 10 n=1 Tax=Thelohanellus kitauei TaxID=669202 RepID=A0A0C2MI33_THEKT|nr:Vacuolar protein sorting/targeting protein 10 [Thelohanellus kitauei]
MTKTYISVDNGKNFWAIELLDSRQKCFDNKCYIEFDLPCGKDVMINHFPDKFTVKFQGIIHKNGYKIRHTYISFNGGMNWKIIPSQIKKLTILNRGGILFGTESKVGTIWYSYDYGSMWTSKYIVYDHFIKIIPIELPNNPVIAAIIYDDIKNIYTIYTLTFSHSFSSFGLMTDRTCDIDDIQRVYVRRYSGTCYQGKEIFYLQKKHYAMCVDNRQNVEPNIIPCPCSIEDFEWYSIIDHSKPNYYYKNNFCVLNPNLEITKSVKICRDGDTPLIHWNGYHRLMNSFAKLDPDLCMPINTTFTDYSIYADYCISQSNVDI